MILEYRVGEGLVPSRPSGAHKGLPYILLSLQGTK